MTPTLKCPACLSTNDSDRERCHVCGADLHPASADPRTTLRDRIASRAEAAGQRFKPYTAGAPRRAETADAKQTVRKELDAAARAFRERHFNTAIEHLLKAIAKEDNDPRSWVLLGEAYLRLDRPYKAAVGYLRALDLNVANDNAWLGLARALKAMDDPAAALEILDRTVQSNPALTEAWSERGLLLEALDRPMDAAKSFQKALELRPDHPTARVRFDKLAPKSAEAYTAPGPEPEPPAEPEPEPAREPELEPTEEAAPEIPPPAPSPPPAAPVEDDEDFPDFADLAEPAPAARAQAPPGRAHPARIRTFVEGLDETLGGGVPWGHVVLLEGSPGTMKSSLAFSILAQNAAQAGLHGLYLSFEERTSSLLKQMGSLNLPLHVPRGSLVVMDPRAAKGLLEERKDWVEAFQSAIQAVKGHRGLDLVVIDSLEALEVLAKFKDRRREIFRLFEWLRDLDVTSVVITERPDWVVGGHVIQGRWDEDFLADGVLHVRQHLVSDVEVQRRLRVVKMRGTRHETGYLALVLDEGRFKVTRAMSP